MTYRTMQQSNKIRFESLTNLQQAIARDYGYRNTGAENVKKSAEILDKIESKFSEINSEAIEEMIDNKVSAKQLAQELAPYAEIALESLESAQIHAEESSRLSTSIINKLTDQRDEARAIAIDEYLKNQSNSQQSNSQQSIEPTTIDVDATPQAQELS